MFAQNNFVISTVIFRSWIAAFLLIYLTGCALPVPIGSELNDSRLNEFIPPKELHVVSLAREGMQLFNNSRFFEAEARFRKALYLDPKLDNVRFNLATTLERTGLYDEAQEVYKDLISRDGDKANFRAAYGRLLVSRGEYEKGRVEFTRARDLAARDDDKALVNALSQSLVTLEFSVGRMDEALCESKQLLLRTKSVESFKQYIKLLLSLGYTQTAIGYMETSGSEILPDDAVISLYLRTLALYGAGKKEDALELSERVLAFPGNESGIDFDLRVLNLTIRFEKGQPNLFEDETTLSFLKVLSESIEASSLTSLYWSPEMLNSVMKMLADPGVISLLEE